MSTRISIVVPLYECADTVATLHERLSTALHDRFEDLEFVLVDDASPTGATWAEVLRLAALDPRVRGLRLDRNVRQTRATFAGLEVAKGQALVVMDGDLEHPPELVPDMVAAFERGHDLVVAARTHDRRSPVRRAGRTIAHLAARAIGVTGPDVTSAFLLMSRALEPSYRAELERTGVQLILPVFLRLARRPVFIPFESSVRSDSGYRLGALARIGWDFAVTYGPPRVAPLASALAAGSVGYGLVRRRTVPLVVAAGVAGTARWCRVRAVADLRDRSEPLYVVGAQVGTGTPGTRRDSLISDAG
ncbi:MAG: glycosyltransferase [Microthrixaceae bacterium]